MDRKELKEKIYNFIVEHKEVAFTELEKFFEEIGIDYEGNNAIRLNDKLPIYAWFNWKSELNQILLELDEEGKTTFYPTTPFIYFIDGKVPDFPIVTSKTGRHIKKDHWLPVVICTKSHERILDLRNGIKE